MKQILAGKGRTFKNINDDSTLKEADAKLLEGIIILRGCKQLQLMAMIQGRFKIYNSFSIVLL